MKFKNGTNSWTPILNGKFSKWIFISNIEILSVSSLNLSARQRNKKIK